LLVPTGGEGRLTQQSADGSSPTLPSPALPLLLPARAPLPARPVGAVRSLLGSQRSRPRFRLVASAWLAPPRAAPRPGAETVQVTFPVWIWFASLSTPSPPRGLEILPGSREVGGKGVTLATKPCNYRLPFTPGSVQVPQASRGCADPRTNAGGHEAARAETKLSFLSEKGSPGHCPSLAANGLVWSRQRGS